MRTTVSQLAQAGRGLNISISASAHAAPGVTIVVRPPHWVDVDVVGADTIYRHLLREFPLLCFRMDALAKMG